VALAWAANRGAPRLPRHRRAAAAHDRRDL